MSQPPPPPPPPPAMPQPASGAQPLSASDENLWSTLAHVGNIIGFLPSLLIFLILGPRSARVKTEAREALNFIITAIAIFIVLAILSAITTAVYIATDSSALDVILGLVGTLIGLVQFAVYVLVIILSIVAAVRVNKGGSYRYPFAIRLIK